MRDFTTKFLIAFIPIFVAIDAIGMVAIFIGLGANVDAKRRQQEAILGLVTALAIAVGFMFLGKLIFQALGITVADFQVAGGLILLVLPCAICSRWVGKNVRPLKPSASCR
ncbi:hypothetical protein BH20VER3_BH20VER3_19470 [soil metagenome]